MGKNAAACCRKRPILAFSGHSNLCTRIRNGVTWQGAYHFHAIRRRTSAASAAATTRLSYTFIQPELGRAVTAARELDRPPFATNHAAAVFASSQ
jgi:hypothetical protein